MKKSLIIILTVLVLLTGCTKEEDKVTTTTKTSSTSTTTTTTEKTTTESTTTSTTKKSTTTTSKKTTSTTKKTTGAVVNKTYNNVAEIKGTKVDKGKTSKGYSIYEIDGVTYVDGFLIANKSYFLPKDFYPKDTYKKATSSTTNCQTCINKTVWSAWQDLQAAAKKDGITLWVQSGYRSYSYQGTLYNNYVKRDGQKEADTYSARPGSSEHQTGLCFDLNNAGRKFNGTKEAEWVDKNAYKFGFIIRYPQGKQSITGYIYESWHLRYVGTDLAKKLYNNGDWITLEEHFGIDSKYK